MIKPSTISQSINKLYVKIINSDCKTICFTSATLQEGITSIASATAKAAATYGRRVLYCDFGNYNTSITKQLNIEVNAKDNTPLELETQPIEYIEEYNFDLISLPSPRPLNTSLIKKESLLLFFDGLKNNYDLIIIDSHSYNKYQPHTLPTRLLCEVADATVLIILSGKATLNDIKETSMEMIQSGANLLGCVMNDRDYPRLVDELCKKTLYLDKYFPKMGALLRKKFRESVILNIEI